jgi:hypothetical protein
MALHVLDIDVSVWYRLLTENGGELESFSIPTQCRISAYFQATDLLHSLETVLIKYAAIGSIDVIVECLLLAHDLNLSRLKPKCIERLRREDGTEIKSSKELLNKLPC